MSARLNDILPRPRADEEEYARMTDYEKGLLHGSIELWDKLDQLVQDGRIELVSQQQDFDKLPKRKQIERPTF